MQEYSRRREAAKPMKGPPMQRVNSISRSLPDAKRRRFIQHGTAIGAALALPALPLLGADAKSDAAGQLANFLDDFTRAEPPADSTNLGADAFAHKSEKNRDTLNRLHAIDRAALKGDDILNYRFAESIIVGRGLEQDRMLWKFDPRVYLQFSPISRVLDNPDASGADAEKALQLLQAVPAQLASGKTNLERNVPRFRELALFMAKGGADIFRDSVPPFAARHTAQSRALLAANAKALEALADFRQFMDQSVPQLPPGDFALGKAAYEKLVKEQYLLPYDSEYLFNFGREQFEITVRELREVAARIEPGKDWKEVAAMVKKEAPEPARMIEAHQEWVNKARDHMYAKNLVPMRWKERVDVHPRQAYLRKTSYYGNFESAKSPDKDGVWVGRWLINPYEVQWDAEVKRQYMAEHDWGTIIVTAPHETYAGHHIHGLYQAHNPHKIRRMFGTPVFSEGWGFYNETLMYDTGFFRDDKTHFRHLQLRLWRVARVIWDVGLNTGRMSYEECVKLLSEGVGFLRWAAELEVDGSAMTPGYRIGYYMGAAEITRMREDVRSRLGNAFTYADFHGRLLQVGNMPPALMREGLFASYGS
jgi:uncharacterized protein (DUF885 family)